MMKKITLFLFLLTTSIGYSQTVLEDFEGTIPATNKYDNFGTIEVAENPTISSEKSLKLITSTTSAGWQGGELIFQGDKLDLSKVDKSVTMAVYSEIPTDILAKVTTGGSASATDAKHTGSGWETLIFDFANGKDGTGAADGVYSNMVFYPTWNNLGGTCSTGCYSGSTANSSPAITLFIDDITGIAVDITDIDATLSDLKVNDVSVAGFSSGTEMYSFSVSAETTIVPAVTAVTSQSGATALVTDASEIPGSTTIVVTAVDGTTTKTYTVSFDVDPEPTNAPATPSARNAWDVINIYGGAYGAEAGLNGVSWDNGSEGAEVTAAGNQVYKVTTGTGDFVGFDIGNSDGFVNATDMTDFHLDIWIGGDYVAGQVFNTNLSNHAGAIGTQTTAITINNAIDPSDGESWISIDASLGSNPRERIAQLVMNYANGGDLPKVIYIDNIYFYRSPTASIENNELLGFSMYPNPTSNILNISAKESIQNAQIFNVLGKEVMSLNINKNTESIDVSSLSSGIYLIKYQSNGAVGTAKSR